MTVAEQLEATWKLREAVIHYAKQAGREVGVQEVLDKVFIPSGLVDLAKTKANQGNTANPPQVFLNSPYGLQYRPEFKDWVPFRHGPVTV
jgi:hypothetical protein